MPGRVRKRVDIGSIRRQEIVEAAEAVIARGGLENLSLSEIEKEAGMSRGQLTYYFKAKEDILLAVFDRLLLRLCQEHGHVDEHGDPTGWLPGFAEMFTNILRAILEHPSPEFRCLQFTFLAQIGHRADYRRCLANLYEEWRQ